MKSLQTSIVINASAQAVWQVLTDFARYPQWNTFIVSVEGRLVVGSRLKNSMVINGKTQVFSPRVLEAEPNRKLIWLGSLWFRGVFDGRHEFIIEPIGQNQVRLVQQEFFSGVLVGPILKMIGKITLDNFEKMNRGIKAEAEKMMVAS